MIALLGIQVHAATARQIPVAVQKDIVIVGGGVGAVSAAVEASRNGASVFLVAPRTYLGEDMAGTMRLWLEPGEIPATDLAREIYANPDLAAKPSLPFTYQADQPFNSRHKDTSPPSKLNSGCPVQSAVTDCVQYDTNVVITADLKNAVEIKAAEVLIFNRAMVFQAFSIATAISDDGKQWKELELVRPHNLGDLVSVPIPIHAKARYVRFNIKRAPSAERLLIGAIRFLSAQPAPVAGDTNGVLAPMHVKKTLENALRDAKVDYLYGCFATDLIVDKDNKPAGIVMANRAGRQAVLAKVIIDASEQAMVARMAGSAFGEFTPGKQTLQWVVIADKTNLHKGIAARRMPFPVTIRDMKGDKNTGGTAAWIEYTLHLDLPDETWNSRARLEQLVRDQTFDSTQLYAADVPFLVPSCGIKSVKAALDNAVAGTVPLEACRPANVERVWVLGGCLDAARSVVTKLLRPAAMMELGARVGVAAAHEAKNLAAPTDVKVLTAASPDHDGGDVKEVLDGLRPLPLVPHVFEAARSLPVFGRYDVVVIGGGTAGAAAGIGAARQGAKTLVVEYLHGLGGVGTLGMIGKFWYGNRVGFTASVPQYPTEIRMEFLRQELRKAGADIWFGTMGEGALVEGNRVTGVAVVTPYGRGLVLAKTVIDGTGNADIAAPAGAQTRFVEDHFALQNSHMPPREVGAYYINGELLPVDVADPLDVRQALAQRKENFFDRGQLVDSRERRRIVGDFTLDWVDQINQRTFPDSIVYAQSDYDSHGYQIHPFFMLRPARPPGDSRYQYHSYVPYRCLLPKGVEGMLVVGIALSVHRDALPIVRMQPDQQNLGYAAGVAAAMAARKNITPRLVDVKALQRHLVEVGNLSASVLNEHDSFPIPAREIAEAVKLVTKDYQGLEILMAQPQESLPQLRRAHDTALGADKLTYAQTLGVMGDAYGVETLLKEANRCLTERDFSKHGAKDNLEPVVQLLWALGGTGDRRSIPVLAAFSKEAARMSFPRFRAIAVSLGKIGDPAAAPTLASMVKSRNNSGDTGELMAVCALYRCGDQDGLARRKLEHFVTGVNGPFSRLAWQVLQSKP